MEKAKQTFNSTLRSWMFFKLAGPDEIHLRVCRELAWSDLTAHGNYFKNGVRTGKVSEDRKKAIIVLTFKKVKRSVDQTISFQLPRKKILVQVFKHLDGNKGIWISQCWFVKNKSRQATEFFSYDMMTGLCIEKKNIFTLEKFLTVSFMTFFSAIQGLPETAIW